MPKPINKTVRDYIRTAMTFYEESLALRDRLTYREFIAAQKIVSVLDHERVRDEDRKSVVQLAFLFRELAERLKEADMLFMADEIDMVVIKLLQIAKVPDEDED